MTDTKIFLQDAQTKKTPIKDLAYQTGDSATVHYRTYRLERSTPVFRRGVPVVILPRFKGLTHFSPTLVNASTKAFQTNITGVAVSWPSQVK